MIKFINKSIEQLTLGERLRQARRGLNLELSQVGQAINVKKEFLEMIEQGDYSRLPSLVYVENYLKVYAAYLGLDWRRLEPIYIKETSFLPKPAGKPAIGHLHQPALYLPKFIYLAIIIIGLTLIFTYLGWQVNNLLKPPTLNIISPVNNLTVNERTIEVSGSTLAGVRVTVNGQEIAVNQQGQFKEVISLQPGFNNLKISAQAKHSREQVIYRQILVEIQP